MSTRLASAAAADVEAPFDVVERITRHEARNFYYGIRLLPKPKRLALCAVYALARRIDDIGDGDLPAEDKLRHLAELRPQIADRAALQASGDPVLVALASTLGEFPVPLGAFGELIDGVERDVTGHVYQTFDDLVVYCRCVAGTVGRLCLGVFGSRPDPEAARYADTLGIALQQTNILRDLREDLLLGRIYLPAEDLDRFGVTLGLDEAGRLRDDDGRLTALVRFAAERARGWYDEGLALVPLLDRRSAASCTAMSGIYRSLLARLHVDPTLVFGGRLSLSPMNKATVAVRALAGRPL